MAKIIEISGPPGAGKTTIIKSLCGNGAANTNCLLHKSLLPRQKLNLFNLVNLAENLPYLVRFRQTRLDEKKLGEAGARFIKENPAFMNAFWESIIFKQKCDINGNDRRFAKAAFFSELIQKYQYIKELKNDKYVLFDEGLIHLLPVDCSITNKTPEDDMKDINRLVQVMPLPDGYIYIDTDIEIILERVQQRKKVARVHKWRSPQEIRELTEKIKVRMSYAKNILGSLGVPVLELDSKQDVQQSKQQIKEFMDRLKVHPSRPVARPDTTFNIQTADATS